MEIKILDTDKSFNDSPDVGESNCFCSRCNKQIKGHEVPLKMCSRDGRSELRYCDNCQRNMGFVF